LPWWLWPNIGVIVGAIIGSFVATLVIRWPRARSIIAGRSACDACGHSLSASELIPLISALAQRGRCRHCQAPIDPKHGMIEMACALVGALAFGLAPGLAGLAGALFGWTLVALIALDVEHYWLPDLLTLPLLLAGIVGGALALDPPLIDRIYGAVGGYASLALIALGYRLLRKREGLGGGDPKLLGAIGAWLGWQPLPWVIVGACGTGLLIVLIKALRGGSVSATDRLPLGALMALAAFPIWLWLA
jgi:leader peptidase (prepilin peptidase) / N-methyltransferase